MICAQMRVDSNSSCATRERPTGAASAQFLGAFARQGMMQFHLETLPARTIFDRPDLLPGAARFARNLAFRVDLFLRDLTIGAVEDQIACPCFFDNLDTDGAFCQPEAPTKCRGALQCGQTR